jgi:cell wall-associated NlpC family hydrolase
MVLLECYGITAPPYAGDYDASDGAAVEAFIANCTAGWQRVENGCEQPGDIAVIAIGGAMCHCGVVLGDGMIAHQPPPPSKGGTGLPRVERYKEGKLAHRVLGFVRWDEAHA